MTCTIEGLTSNDGHNRPPMIHEQLHEAQQCIKELEQRIKTLKASTLIKPYVCPKPDEGIKSITVLDEKTGRIVTQQFD